MSTLDSHGCHIIIIKLTKWSSITSGKLHWIRSKSSLHIRFWSGSGGTGAVEQNKLNRFTIVSFSLNWSGCAKKSYQLLNLLIQFSHQPDQLAEILIKKTLQAAFQFPTTYIVLSWHKLFVNLTKSNSKNNSETYLNATQKCTLSPKWYQRDKKNINNKN